MNEAIKDGITKEETERIAFDLELPANTELKFELFGGIPYIVDETRDEPSFESNGKKFWIASEQG